MMLTEHPLDTMKNEDLPENMQNCREKSFVLAPYNSHQDPDETLSDDEMPGFEPRAIKFGKQVREINRLYE